ncbi:hypothetical protein [Geotalea sp. SG265]|uniref:hypothetical protein n=1 Tax=Geotalea sp. SG265 TaxID=2922867 RepID=UPI001FAF25CD|nr:hypothetical protein [Geotalea sp. SG265]
MADETKEKTGMRVIVALASPAVIAYFQQFQGVQRTTVAIEMLKLYAEAPFFVPAPVVTKEKGEGRKGNGFKLDLNIQSPTVLAYLGEFTTFQRAAIIRHALEGMVARILNVESSPPTPAAPSSPVVQPTLEDMQAPEVLQPPRVPEITREKVPEAATDSMLNLCDIGQDNVFGKF